MIDERMIYAMEYQRIVALEKRLRDVDELLQRFPEDDFESREFLHAASSNALNRITVSHRLNVQDGKDEIRFYSVEILSREKLDEIKASNPQLFFRISPVYMEFLKEKGRITK